MSLKTAKPVMRSAAWRISLWATLAFALGTTLVFAVLHRFVSNDIQRRSDAWLSGEVEVLGDVAERTPKDALYSRVLGEVAELASREVPNKLRADSNVNDSVFFLLVGRDNSKQLWVGPGDGVASLRAVQRTRLISNAPSDLHVDGFPIPFRVASISAKDGSHIYLGLSERDELRVLRNLRFRFLLLGSLIIFFGFAIVFYTTIRMLGYVRQITEAASRIGQSDLSSRVPVVERNDEVGHLAFTLNSMLDRIENAMHQLHTITDALAHDLRSPLTAIRGKLEVSLSTGLRTEQAEPLVCAIEELDRLTEFLNTSLDVAEARADALRLSRSDVNLEDLVRTMVDLYEPSMSEKGLAIRLRSSGPVTIHVDAALMHRVVANLLDNEMKYLPACSAITVNIQAGMEDVVLLMEDDGPGFAPEICQHVFDRGVKSGASSGYGLGLAFVDAVVCAHGGVVEASNRQSGGAQLKITLPLVGEV